MARKPISTKNMARESIPTNTQRKLWSQCGGYCQNPNCNKYLFRDIEGESVSLVNCAHIIGAGNTGPRSEHALADSIDKKDISNLIMLCLDCHKTIDELEDRYSVAEISQWKDKHSSRIQGLFKTPVITNENHILRRVNDLLEENKLIFEEYGPFSKQAIEGVSGDAKIIWKRRCLDTILPNNQKIIDLIEDNKSNFAYPWELYRQMLTYKIHANSFKENCIFEDKINDYKLFPLEFDYFVKSKLGIKTQDLEIIENQEIEYRQKTIFLYINKFLASHSFIKRMEAWNVAIFKVFLADGRELKVFVTATYYFTEYTLEKIQSIDPNIDAIICSYPYSTYSKSAKKQCVKSNIGLFMLKEFMGAVPYKGEKFLNYLLKEDKASRISRFSSVLNTSQILNCNCKVYLFGSYLRQNVFDDIDIILVYPDNDAKSGIELIKDKLNKSFQGEGIKLDFMICSEDEFLNMELIDDNREPII